METPLIGDVVNGGIIEAVHINQFVPPVNNLENAATWFDDSTGSSNAYAVEFPASLDIDALTDGNVIHFRANHDNTGAATLQVNELDAVPIRKNGNEPLVGGEIISGQIVVAIYDATNVAFQLMAMIERLDDLADVAITTPGNGHVLIYAGAPDNRWENRALHADDIADGSVSDAEFEYLSGVTSAIQSQLDAKAETLDDLTDVAVSSPPSNRDVLIYDGATDNRWESRALQAADLPTGISAANIANGLVTNAQFQALEGVTSGIQSQLDGKSLTSHAHALDDLSDVSASSPSSGQALVFNGTDWVPATPDTPPATIGELTDVSISDPTDGQVLVYDGTTDHCWENRALQATDIASGQVGLARGGTHADLSATGPGFLKQTSSGADVTVAALAAGDIASGQIGLARGGTHADLSATGPGFLKQASSGADVTVAALAAGDVPSGIDAAKLANGSVSNAEFQCLDGITSGIQSQLDGKAASSHGHNASDISSGYLLLNRGGTGADLSVAGAGLVRKAELGSTELTTGGLTLDDMPAGLATLDGDDRLPIAQFPSNAGAIRYARCSPVTTEVGTYSATGGTSGRGQITGAPDEVDGVALGSGDRLLLLVGCEDDLEANGLWVVSTVGSGSNGVWDRAPDMDADNEVAPGTIFYIAEGDTLGRSMWLLVGLPGLIVGGSSGSELGFVQLLTASALPSGGTAIGNNPDSLPETPDPADDEFEGGALDTAGARFSGATAWAWDNQGNSSVGFNRGAIVIHNDPSDADDTLRGIFQVAPTAPWTYRAKIARAVQSNDDFQWLGLFVRNSGNSKWHMVGLRRHSGTGLANTTSDCVGCSGNLMATGQEGLWHSWYFEIENDGTKLYYRVSGTGHDETFYELDNRTISSSIGAVTHIGLGFFFSNSGSSANNVVQGVVVDWFRRIA